LPRITNPLDITVGTMPAPRVRGKRLCPEGGIFAGQEGGRLAHRLRAILKLPEFYGIVPAIIVRPRLRSLAESFVIQP
jgi:hypothetical protein